LIYTDDRTIHRTGIIKDHLNSDKDMTHRNTCCYFFPLI